MRFEAMVQRLVLVLGVVVAWSGSTVASSSQVLAGPMVGHITESTASIWLQVQSNAEVRAEAIQIGRRVMARRTIGARGFMVLQIESLLPGQPVHVVVRSRAGEDPWEEHDLFFETPAPPEATGTLRIAFGSCSQDSRRPYVPVYEAMAFERPDIAVFVGDNSYFVVGDGNWTTTGPIGDWNSSHQMITRHMLTRTNPYIQRLLRTVPSYGIWDDHDYGPNNSNRTFANREVALEVFKLVWANPGYGTPNTKGIFSKFRRGPADIFLMDNRYHKWVATEDTPDVPPSEAVIWGESQLEWLLDGLRRSVAPVKVIANGTQIISKDGRGEGHFNEAPAEAERLFAFLKENKIGGVVILSGDRHFTEVLRMQQEDGPDIIEFTSSPIQQGQAVAPLPRDHETHEWAMRGNCYGLVTISVEGGGEGFVRFEMRDANNYVPVAEGRPAMSEFPLRSLMYE